MGQHLDPGPLGVLPYVGRSGGLGRLGPALDHAVIGLMDPALGKGLEQGVPTGLRPGEKHQARGVHIQPVQGIDRPKQACEPGFQGIRSRGLVRCGGGQARGLIHCQQVFILVYQPEPRRRPSHSRGKAGGIPGAPLGQGGKGHGLVQGGMFDGEGIGP